MCLVVFFLNFIYLGHALWIWGFPSGSDNKESTCNSRDLGSIPGSGRSPGEGNDCLLQFSCLENPMDRGAWQATVQAFTKSWTRRKQLSQEFYRKKELHNSCCYIFSKQFFISYVFHIPSFLSLQYFFYQVMVCKMYLPSKASIIISRPSRFFMALKEIFNSLIPLKILSIQNKE